MAKSKSTPASPAGLVIETVPIDSLHLDPANARRHPDRNLDAIKASLARFKQQKPLVVDGDGIVRAGNGTLEAARALGWTEIAVVRTPLKGSEATAYALSDNRTSELAVWHDEALAQTLRALQSEDFDLGAVGFSDAEVDALLEGLAGELGGGLSGAGPDATAPEDFGSYGEDIATEYQCPKCSYAWSGRPKPGADLD